MRPQHVVTVDDTDDTAVLDDRQPADVVPADQHGRVADGRVRRGRDRGRGHDGLDRELPVRPWRVRPEAEQIPPRDHAHELPPLEDGKCREPALLHEGLDPRDGVLRLDCHDAGRHKFRYQAPGLVAGEQDREDLGEQDSAEHATVRPGDRDRVRPILAQQRADPLQARFGRHRRGLAHEPVHCHVRSGRADPEDVRDIDVPGESAASVHDERLAKVVVAENRPGPGGSVIGGEQRDLAEEVGCRLHQRCSSARQWEQSC